jgi:hypothetical protein
LVNQAEISRELEGSLMRWLGAAVLMLAGMASAQAYTCADVRALTPEQQAYYVKVYNISLELQDRIRQACYGTKAKHVIAASDERSANHAAQNERDARAGN